MNTQRTRLKRPLIKTSTLERVGIFVVVKELRKS